MQTILIGDVNVPESRQRTKTDEKKFKELKDSIRKEGLFHAIILTEENVLVAGATRLRAIAEIYTETGEPIFYDGKEVPFAQIPFTFTHRTDDAALFRIELEENLRREQLSPVDEAVALAKLHELTQEAAPLIMPSMPELGKQKVTFEQTAEVLGKITGEPKTNDAQKISDSILVEQYKDEPEVKRAKTLGEAARIARKIAERNIREVLGQLEAGNVTPSRHILHQGSCETEFAKIADGSIDVIIADPPYGIGADSFGDQSLVGHTYEDDEQAFWNVFNSIMNNCSRICKPDAAMFIFVDILMWKRIKWTEKFAEDGWYLWPTPLIWHKPNRGHAPQPKRGPSRRYEAILYAVRGQREVRKTGSDVLTFNVPDDRLHGAGKPVELYKELLSWHCYPGDKVVDPCAGSGTVIKAAELLDLTAVAIEQDPASAQLCREVIEKLKEE